MFVVFFFFGVVWGKGFVVGVLYVFGNGYVFVCLWYLFVDLVSVCILVIV